MTKYLQYAIELHNNNIAKCKFCISYTFFFIMVKKSKVEVFQTKHVLSQWEMFAITFNIGYLVNSLCNVQ